MKKRYLGLILLSLVCLTGADEPASLSGRPQIPAMLCIDCGFGAKANNCVKWGKWVGSAQIPARLCNNCGFGSKAKNCVKCGKWIGTNGVPAKLCSDCGFGRKQEDCVKCGKWTK